MVLVHGLRWGRRWLVGLCRRTDGHFVLRQRRRLTLGIWVAKRVLDSLNPLYDWAGMDCLDGIDGHKAPLLMVIDQIGQNFRP